MNIQRRDAIDLCPIQAAQTDAPALIPTQGLLAQVVHAQSKGDKHHSDLYIIRHEIAAMRMWFEGVEKLFRNHHLCHSEHSEESLPPYRRDASASPDASLRSA